MNNVLLVANSDAGPLEYSHDEYESEHFWPRVNMVFGIDSNGQVTVNPRDGVGHKAVISHANGISPKWGICARPIPFPRSIQVSNNDQTLINVETIKQFLRNGHKARAFILFDDYDSKDLEMVLAFACKQVKSDEKQSVKRKSTSDAAPQPENIKKQKICESKENVNAEVEKDVKMDSNDDSKVDSLFQMTVKQTLGSKEFVRNNLAFCKKIRDSLIKNVKNVEFSIDPTCFKDETVVQRFARAEDDDEWVFDHICNDLDDNKCNGEEWDGCVFADFYNSRINKPPFNVYRLRGTDVFLCEEDLGNREGLKAIADSVSNVLE